MTLNRIFSNWRNISLTAMLIFTALILSAQSQAAALTAFDPVGTELSEHRGKGKWLVVKIWASDCGICNREAHKYVDYYEFEAGEKSTVVGISLDGNDTAAAKAFIDRHSVSYPNYITDFDTGANWFRVLTGQAFAGTPAFIIFDPTGAVRAQQIGAVPVELIVQFINANS